jgi:inosose dehydratase
MIAPSRKVKLEIGNAPLSWGVFEGDASDNPPWPTVLDELKAAGYTRTELGPIGFYPEEIELLRTELDSRGLSLSGGFVYEHMHDPRNRDIVLRNTRRVGRILAALGANYLVVIDRMVPERQATAGRPEQAERLGQDDWQDLREIIELVGKISAEEFGLRPVLHPHCGSHIEFADEIKRILSEIDATNLGLCIDTGHSAVAGMQASDLVSTYQDRVEYFHLKDAHPGAILQMREQGLTFDEALGIGLFCPLGKGFVDFKALLDSLERLGFQGVATVEQDPDPRIRGHSGLASARESMDYLRSVGMQPDSTDD